MEILEPPCKRKVNACTEGRGRKPTAALYLPEDLLPKKPNRKSKNNDALYLHTCLHSNINQSHTSSLHSAVHLKMSDRSMLCSLSRVRFSVDNQAPLPSSLRDNRLPHSIPICPQLTHPQTNPRPWWSAVRVLSVAEMSSYPPSRDSWYQPNSPHRAVVRWNAKIES